MDNKLSKKDGLIIGGTSLILAIFTVIYTVYYLYNPTRFFLTSFLTLILGLPFKILNIIYALINQIGISNATSTWLASLIQYVAPIFGFFLWCLIFYILAKLTKKFFKTTNIWYTNIVTLVFLGIFLISYIIFSFGLTYYPKDGSLFNFKVQTNIIK